MNKAVTKSELNDVFVMVLITLVFCSAVAAMFGGLNQDRIKALEAHHPKPVSTACQLEHAAPTHCYPESERQ